MAPLLLEVLVPVRTRKYDVAVAFALRFPNSLVKNHGGVCLYIKDDSFKN